MPTKQPMAAPFQRCPPASCPATAPPSPYLRQPPGRASAELGAAASVTICRRDQSHLPHQEPPLRSGNVVDAGGFLNRHPTLCRACSSVRRALTDSLNVFPCCWCSPLTDLTTNEQRGSRMRKARRGWTMPEEEARSMLRLLEERVRASDIRVEHRDM